MELGEKSLAICELNKVNALDPLLARSPTDRRRSIFDGFILLTLLLFLIFEVFQGPLRYYLSRMGGVLLAYVPKGLMLLSFIIVVLRSLWFARLDRSVLLVILTFAFFMMVGVTYTLSIGQPLLGFFSLLPMLFGVASEPAFSRFGDRVAPYALMLWFCVAVGVGFNYFHSMPWVGFTYQLGDTEVEVSREWSYFGVERIAGFARASFEAATQLLFIGLVCAMHLQRRLLAVIVWIATGALIGVTTTKTTLGIYFFLTVFFPLVSPRFAWGDIRRLVSVVLPIMIAVIGIALPVGTLLFYGRSGVVAQQSGVLFASLGIRLAQMWPDTFDMIFRHGSLVLGRGLGGIGAAQKVFEPTIYSPADNMYLYLYGTFGVFALVIIGVFTRSISRLRLDHGRSMRLFWLLGVSVMMEGWTVSCIEGGTMAVVTGLTVAFSLRVSRMVSHHQKGVAFRNGVKADIS